MKVTKTLTKIGKELICRLKKNVLVQFIFLQIEVRKTKQNRFVFHIKTHTYFHIDFNNDHINCCRKFIVIVIYYYIGLDHIHPVSSHFLHILCNVDFVVHFPRF